MLKKHLTLENDQPDLVSEITVTDHLGNKRKTNVVGEVPLTIIVDGEELVTLMTMGSRSRELTLGYLCNQGLIEDLNEIEKIEIDWLRERALVTTRGTSYKDRVKNRGRKSITSGCGQGAIFSCSLNKLYEKRLPDRELKLSKLFALLQTIAKRDTIYKQSGAVHACALCDDSEPIFFVEDVGRHNAADIIAGMMREKNIDGGDKIFYTTGRLTSEIVMKVALIDVPVLVSRSGVTSMGLELARDLNVIMIARAKAASLLIYNKEESVDRNS